MNFLNNLALRVVGTDRIVTATDAIYAKVERNEEGKMEVVALVSKDIHVLCRGADGRTTPYVYSRLEGMDGAPMFINKNAGTST